VNNEPAIFAQARVPHHLSDKTPMELIFIYSMGVLSMLTFEANYSPIANSTPLPPNGDDNKDK